VFDPSTGLHVIGFFRFDHGREVLTIRAHKDLRPEDITVVVDTRERTPPAVDLLLNTVRGTLQTGDYSVQGLEHLVRIERKSLQDLVMCVGRERVRFDRCIERLRHFPLAMIVIEASESQVELKSYRGEVEPNAVLGSVHSWRARGINIDWAGSSQNAAKHISRTLFAFARERYRELGAFYENLKIAGEEKTG
jgi:DNA excision repair protein ERCC-4